MKIKMTMTNNFKLVPEGERRLKIIKSECTPSGKPNKWTLTFEDSEGGLIYNRFDLKNDKSLYAMAKFVEEVLQMKDGEEFDTSTDPQKCVGLEITANVVHSEGTQVDDNGEPRKFANIENRTVKLVESASNESPRNSIASSVSDLDI